MQTLFDFGPVQVDVIEIRKLLQALDDIILDNFKPVGMDARLHEGSDEPKVKLLLFLFLFDVRNYLL